MRRALVCFLAVLASGCFRWAPISSLSSVEDARVVIEDGSSPRRTLVHATAHGRTIEAQTSEGGDRVEVDVTPETRVLARRLNAPATGAIIALSAIGVAGTVFGVALIIIAMSVRNVAFDGQ
jgi:hypothetical protein